MIDFLPACVSVSVWERVWAVIIIYEKGKKKKKERKKKRRALSD